MARRAIVGSFAVLLTVVALGQARAQPCCKSVCANGTSDCERIPDCAGTCSNFCAGFSSRCVGATQSACPDGQDPLDCAEGCQPICPPTLTPTSTPNATPTNTPVAQGGACSTPSQCSTGFCVDSVCCDTACTDPLKRCNLPGEVGTCSSPAATAPALTPWGLLIAAALLASVGAFALRQRMRGR